jgi:hypothetical protein
MCTLNGAFSSGQANDVTYGLGRGIGHGTIDDGDG